MDYLSDLDEATFLPVLDDLPLWSAPFGMKLLEYIPMGGIRNVLDIGSGTGFPMLELAMRFGSGTLVTGLDPWEAAVKRVNEKIRIFRLNNAKMVTGKAEKMPFPEKSFDLIVSNNGLNNVDDLSLTLHEIRRVGKGGALFFTMNLASTMQNFYQIFEKVLKESGLGHKIPALHKHIDQKRPGINGVESLLETNGIRLNRKISDQFDLRYASGSAFLNNPFIRLAFLPPWAELLLPEERIVVFTRIEQELNILSEKEKEFRTNVPFILFDCSL